MGQGHVHDWDPGIAPNGLFWTIRIPPESVQVDLAKATATWRAAEVPLPDEISGLNGTITMAMQWGGGVTPAAVDDPANGFAGIYSECNATIEWTGKIPGFTFVSSPATTTTTRFAALGRERNGVFYDASMGANPFYAQRIGAG